MLMRIVIKTTNSNPIPEIIFSGSNDEFKKDMFKIINGYTQNSYTIKWFNDCIVFKKDDVVICFYIFDYNSKTPSSLKKEYRSQIF